MEFRPVLVKGREGRKELNIPAPAEIAQSGCFDKG